MNQAAIIHRPTSDYIYPGSRNTLELQLITARADADKVELWYWMRYETDSAKIRRASPTTCFRTWRRSPWAA